MAVFVRPDRGAVATKRIITELVDGASISHRDEDRYCLILTGCLLLDKEGEVIKDGVLKAGQKASLVAGKIKADKYHLMLVPNPELARAGYIGGLQIVEPFCSDVLEWTVKAERQIDVASLPYLFRVYIVD